MITCVFSGIDVVLAKIVGDFWMWKMLAKAYKFQEKTRKKNFAESFAQIAELWTSAAWHTRACAQRRQLLKTGWTCCYGPRTSSHFVWGYEGAGTMECSSHAAATVHRRTMTFVELCRVPARTVPCTFQLLVHHNILAKKNMSFLIWKNSNQTLTQNWHRNLKYIKSILFSNKKKVPKRYQVHKSKPSTFWQCCCHTSQVGEYLREEVVDSVIGGEDGYVFFWIVPMSGIGWYWLLVQLFFLMYLIFDTGAVHIHIIWIYDLWFLAYI